MSDFDRPIPTSDHSEAGPPSTQQYQGNTVNGGSSLQNTKDSVLTGTKNAVNAASNHPLTQNAKAGLQSTQADFNGLSSSKSSQPGTAATGQPLTPYHSYFYNLLTWKHPRATGVVFTSIIAFILAVRFLHIAPLLIKYTFTTLGIVSAVEVAGKLITSQGFVSAVRPSQYYTIPKEYVESTFDDLHNLLNFFVIEVQRILFVENVFVTIGAFAVSLVSYGLVKFLPYWILALISTIAVFTTPLVYLQNQEVIHAHLNHASDVVQQQTAQARELAGQHTSRATETVKAYTGDYVNKAQGYIGSARGRSTSPETTITAAPKQPLSSTTGNAAPPYAEKDFPAAPKQEPYPSLNNTGELPSHGNDPVLA